MPAQPPVQITFRHTEPSNAAADRIRDEAASLEHFYDRITSFHVVVEAPHKHRQHAGRTWHVGIEISVPGSRIVVSHEPSNHHQQTQGDAPEHRKQDELNPDHADLYVAIRDAFAKARRQLEDYARVQRGDTKHRAVQQ